MGLVVACIAASGATAAVIGTVYSIGWLIMLGGFALVGGALALSSTRLPR